MRKYINKGIIITLLIIANLFLKANKEMPNYEKSEIKKRFTLTSEKNESHLKRAKKINIAKHDDTLNNISKNEIINKVLMSTSTSFIPNYQDYDEDPFDLMNEDAGFIDDIDEYDAEAIVLDAGNENSIKEKWSSSNASLYYEDEKNIIYSNNEGSNIILTPNSSAIINKEYVKIDFNGCSDAKLKIIKDGQIKEINLSGASDFKYFYIGKELKGSSIVSIEFISDVKKAFYLSIGEIDYE
ncbi:hypothetical protein [Fenollaria massiliensis]|uniref:Uncharacterized protein n=1 Tax=Fenollaria massiliensis TaxID=938288 RepID=A0A9E7DK85_9FIRM|nr:hypothetical protein [Fenollaria massiliensis]UQK59763.1 hypothetical protein M1R53_03725 [Fenollaria massiliensis]